MAANGEQAGAAVSLSPVWSKPYASIATAARLAPSIQRHCIVEDHAKAARSASSTASSCDASSLAVSAAQPAATLECLEEVRRWLETGNVWSGNALVESLGEAFAVLARAPRPTDSKVRPPLRKLRVEQWRQGMRRPSAEIIRDLEDKGIHTAQKVQAELAHTPQTTGAVSAAEPTAACECLEDVRCWLAAGDLLAAIVSLRASEKLLLF